MKNKMFRYIFLFLSLLALTGAFNSCITAKKTNYLQDNSYKIPKYKDSVNYEEYKLNKGDKLYLRVYAMPTDKKLGILFNGSSQIINPISSSSDNNDLFIYIVKDDGTIQLPSTGSIYVFGKTLRETKKIIEESIAPLFKDRFSITLNIVDRYFSIITNQSSGRFPISKEKMTIFQALAIAGDIDTYGDRSKIKIIREVNGTSQIRTFDIRSKSIIDSEFYYIQPNDVIYVQELKEHFFAVTSFGAALATIFSTLSFGLLVYNLVIPKTN